MMSVSLLVLASFVVVAGALLCAWRHGSLHPTEQEIVDLEFDRIIGALDGHSIEGRRP